MTVNPSFKPCLDRDGCPYHGYFVNQSGDVLSLKSWRGSPFRMLKQLPQEGYRMVHLYRDGRRQHRKEFVHLLVARAWFGMPSDPTLEVNHGDGIKNNNNVSNLEWVTRQENMQHAFKTGLKVGNIGSENGTARMTESAVKEARQRYADGEGTYKSLADDYGVGKATIAHIIKERTWTHV